MFDLSFYELVVLGIIALIVLGPEKLPQAVRTIGTYYAKFRRTLGTIKAEMEAELDLAETRQQVQRELDKIKQDKSEIQKEMAQLRGSMRQFEQQQNNQLNQSGSAPAYQASTQPDSYPTDADSSPNSKPTDSSVERTSHDASLNLATPANPVLDKDAATELNTDTRVGVPAESAQDSAKPTRPWENMWFLLGDYDRAKRLPPAPLLPNYQASPLLYVSFDRTHPYLSDQQQTDDQLNIGYPNSNNLNNSPPTRNIEDGL